MSCSEQPLVAMLLARTILSGALYPSFVPCKPAAAQKPVTPHTLLRPSIPLCRLFHFIDSRVTFIVVSAK